MEKPEFELLVEINERLKQSVALQLVAGKQVEDQILILREMKFDWKFIALVTGMTVDAAKKRSERMLKNPKVSKNGAAKRNGE